MSFSGGSNLVEQTPVNGWDPRTGSFVQRIWTGTPGAVATAAAALRTAKVKFQVEDGPGGWKKLLATYGAEADQPADQPITDNWDLDGEDLEKSIWQHPKTIAIFNAIKADKTADPLGGGTWCSYLKGWVDVLARNSDEKPPGYTSTPPVTESGIYARFSASDFPSMNTTLKANLRLLIKDVSAGVESWPLSRFVLRHTLGIGPGTSIRPNYVNVGKIYTTTELLAAETVWAVISDSMPSGYWLKRTPKVVQTGANRWTITQEYWHSDDYSTFLYDPKV